MKSPEFGKLFIKIQNNKLESRGITCIFALLKHLQHL